MAVKNIMPLFLLLLLANCTTSKNEKGNLRIGLSVFTIVPKETPEAYHYIDTTKLYKAIEDPGDGDNIALTKYDYYLKFYGKGRVGRFTGILKDTLAFLNPVNAQMGYYAIKDNRFIMEYYVKHPQGSKLYKERYLERKGAIFVMTEGGSNYKYQIIDLNPKYLTYTPDW